MKKRQANPARVFHEYINDKPQGRAYIGLIRCNLEVIADLVMECAKSRLGGLK